MSDIYWLSQIQYAERFLVGDELLLLSQLLQNEQPILPGFVIGHNWWCEFLGLIPQELWQEKYLHNNRQDYQTRQAKAHHHRQIIQQVTIPQSWQTKILQAAQQLDSPSLILQPFISNSFGDRSSINSLWRLPFGYAESSRLTTQLRSPTCNCNGYALTTALKSAWSELFSASSLLYWQKLGFNQDDLNLSVLVRPLKSAYASGTIEVSEHFITIKANWGLAQSLLQGDAEPDEYYVDRDLGQILAQHLGHKNYAYRSKNLGLSVPINDCLEAYLPSEELTETYVLNREAIAQLIQITQELLEQQPQIKYLVWTTFHSTANPQVEQFYIAQCGHHLLTHSALVDKLCCDLNLSSEPPLLSGVAASPGTIKATTVVISNLDHHPQLIPANSILVTKEITPQQIPLIKQVKGIITEMGGRNSHGAIVARELGIPAIANATDATKILTHGERILLDGNNGHVYPPSKQHPLNQVTVKSIVSPTYPLATKLMVNLAQIESIPISAKLPIDGVGLLRSELLLTDLLSSQVLAQWQESWQRQFVATLSSYLRQFGAAFAPRPVFYRSLDLYAQDATNSVLGDRGTYSYLSDRTLFDLELEALQTVIAEGNHNLKLILPFVRSVEEFQFCYRRLENIGLTAQNSFQVWIMAEVPSVIMLLPEYIRAGVQGITIGTNDLTQLLLGVDREQTQFSDRGLNANHPAMQKAIAELIKTAHNYDIECCICGQAPVEHPDLIEKLVQWGIDAISVEPNAVAQTYKAIARTEKRILLNLASRE